MGQIFACSGFYVVYVVARRFGAVGERKWAFWRVFGAAAARARVGRRAGVLGGRLPAQFRRGATLPVATARAVACETG